MFSDWDLFFDSATYSQAGKVGERATHVVKLEAAGLEPLTVHVDAETGDVLRADSMEPMGRGLPDIAVTTVFSDHRDVGGLRLPHVVTSTNDAAGSMVLTYESIETGVEVGDAAFSLD